MTIHYYVLICTLRCGFSFGLCFPFTLSAFGFSIQEHCYYIKKSETKIKLKILSCKVWNVQGVHKVFPSLQKVITQTMSAVPVQFVAKESATRGAFSPISLSPKLRLSMYRSAAINGTENGVRVGKNLVCSVVSWDPITSYFAATFLEGIWTTTTWSQKHCCMACKV